ncbi:pilus assembly protein TadG-related protein [Nocardioides bruguierae]|uniref:Pilus assembly protein TadG-related protein n=1 Tax=Nocardioides bruguierae TaxID=2945102 RepID=A0A9X2D7C8_9ACTN|nr:pilus assembly protein TadG-related protein [Nocardioides bruguierae]MCM0620510.1 pilus assembly protein TadG-related protein [Nocardioides bruguierae]
MNSVSGVSTVGEPRARRKDDAGQTTVLVVGFLVVLLGAVAIVTDASAAYLQRSGLSTLADGAALYGADAGAAGTSLYTEGVPEGALPVDADAARAGVASYLDQVGATSEYPGLSAEVSVSGDTVLVRLRAPLDLPLTVPGGPGEATVAAEGSASTTTDG